MIRRNNHHNTPSKIHQALELLNEAALEKKEELFDALENQYVDFRQVIADANKTVRKQTATARKKTAAFLRSGEEKIEQTAVDTAEAVENKIKQRPWLFLGGVALSAFVIGYAKGSK
jgi:hypothetical protein